MNTMRHNVAVSNRDFLQQNCAEETIGQNRELAKRREWECFLFWFPQLICPATKGHNNFSLPEWRWGFAFRRALHQGSVDLNKKTGYPHHPPADSL